MENFVLVLIILAAVIPAVIYIAKARKSGQCIGCPHAKKCGGKCGCHSQDK